MKQNKEGQEMWSVYAQRSLIIVTMLALAGCRDEKPPDNASPGVTPPPVTDDRGDTGSPGRSGTIVERSPTPPLPTTTSPGARKESNLTLQSPLTTIRSNPFEVRGLARTFENHVTINVLDEQKRPLIETHATATGDLGQMNPFSRSILLTRSPGRKVTIELVDHSAKDGSVREKVTQTVAYEVPDTSMQLYFSQAGSGIDCTKVVAVERPAPKSRSLIRATVEALLAGPDASERKQGLSAPFPRGTNIRGVNLKEGVAIVDFDESMRNVGGSCRAQALRAMIEKSLRGIEGVSSVEIRAGGSKELALQP